MICVGIDVAKDKHDCFIISSEGVVLSDVFTIPNDMTGFNCLLQRIQACSAGQDRFSFISISSTLVFSVAIFSHFLSCLFLWLICFQQKIQNIAHLF